MKVESSFNHRSTLAIVSLLFLCSFSDAAEVKTRHSDERHTIKLLLEPKQGAQLDANSAAEAEKYLRAQAGKFGLSQDLHNIQLAEVRESLTASHYRFQQIFDGIDVAQSEIVVSIGKANNEVLKVYNTTYPVTKADMAQLSKAKWNTPMKSTEALQKAWQLQPRGSYLLHEPQAKLVYIRYKNQFRLIYAVTMKSRPLAGHWEYSVDARSGEILGVRRLDIPYKRDEGYDNFDLQVQKFEGKTQQSFEDARKAIKAQLRSNTTNKTAFRALANGSARVFDPDPRTTLNDASLEPSSPPSAFQAAYQNVTLRDIDFTGGIYSLSGPWVSIMDIESPVIAPSTTSDGNWYAERDETAFYDAMVYYHVDKNQRYIQSLGFTGATGIQELSIGADPNGVSQEDNAFYDPVTNQLVFGNAPSCVGNAEDADVILHEYGHAILYGINSTWAGGDGDAIHEGFGDYWAGSYSFSTPNGQLFNPDWIFSWNGHSDCWVGRFLDRIDMRYDPAESPYYAHALHSGGYSDELWSTPLFQSLKDLIALGVPRAEVDTILLEANFGLSAGVTMREMAEIIVATAENLYPGGPHAGVFQSWFYRMEIAESPLTIGNHQLANIGTNLIVDPGEIVELTLPLTNNGLGPMQNIELSINALNNQVVILDGSNSVSTIAVGETNSSSVFRFFLPFDYVCGEDLALVLNIEYLDSSTNTIITKALDYSLEVGESATRFQSVSPSLAIPDNDAIGVTSVLGYSGGTPIQANDLRVWFDLSHTFIGDLRIELTPPSGNNTVTVWRRQGGFNQDINGFVPGDYVLPADRFDDLVGENPNGVWTLRVIDEAGDDLGTLNSWGIELTQSLGCAAPASGGELVIGQLSLDDSGANSFVDPGEFIQLSLPLYNTDTADLTNVSVVLSAPTNAELINGSVNFSLPLAAGQEGDAGPFDLKIPEDYDCSQNLLLDLQVSYDGPLGSVGAHSTQQFAVGHRQEVDDSLFPSAPIPDYNSTTNLPGVVSSRLTVSESMQIIPEQFSVHLDIRHTYVADLGITLTSPAGTEIELVENYRQYSGELVAVFPDDIEPLSSFDLLAGEDTQGVWTLTVTDLAEFDVGELLSWGIEAAGPMVCESANHAPQATITNNNRQHAPSSTVTLSATASSDLDGDALQFSWVQTAGPTVVLSDAQSASPSFVAPSGNQTTNLSFQVTVVDGFGAMSTAVESVRISNSSASGNGGGGGSGGGSLDRSSVFILLILCCVAFHRRRRQNTFPKSEF